MFGKEEAKKIRQEFWIWFGKEFPRKWLLYNTKIKDVTLKFTFTNKKAEVSMDIEPNDTLIREYYYDKLLSLKTILTNEYLPQVIFDENYMLENGKILSRVYVTTNNVSVYNRESWDIAATFLYNHMEILERFFLEYQDIIDS